MPRKYYFAFTLADDRDDIGVVQAQNEKAATDTFAADYRHTYNQNKELTEEPLTMEEAREIITDEYYVTQTFLIRAHPRRGTRGVRQHARRRAR